jgi:hypothetical protein
MPIVDVKSDAVDQGAGALKEPVDPIRCRALLRAACGTVANASTDSNGSVYRLATIPSRAILRPETQLDLTGWGYAAATLGVARERGAVLTANGLAGTITIGALAGALTTPVAKFGLKWGKPLWESCGLAADPGGNLDVVITTAANATGAGVAKFDFVWQID